MNKLSLQSFSLDKSFRRIRGTTLLRLDSVSIKKPSEIDEKIKDYLNYKLWEKKKKNKIKKDFEELDISSHFLQVTKL